MFNSNVPSVADIAAVMGNNGMNNGWGWGNDWWAIIIILALFGGFGNRGWGMGGNGGNCCCNPCGGGGVYAEVQRGFDTQGITNKLNGLEQGLCSLGYDQLAQMNGINQNLMTTGWNLQQSIQNLSVANMQSSNDISRQLADCCCENRASIAQVRYDMATDTCAITTAINQAAQAIMQNDNANYRALHDEQIQARIDAKDEKIADLTARLNNCDRDSALQGMATYVINSVRPTPVPSWNVPNPYAGYGFGFQQVCQQPIPVQVVQNGNPCCNQYQ